jgi:hypothetical protein
VRQTKLTENRSVANRDIRPDCYNPKRHRRTGIKIRRLMERLQRVSSIMTFHVQDFAREQRASDSNQQILQKAQSCRSEFLPNPNIIFPPSSHPQEDRPAESWAVNVESRLPKIDILAVELRFRDPEELRNSGQRCGRHNCRPIDQTLICLFQDATETSSSR